MDFHSPEGLELRPREGVLSREQLLFRGGAEQQFDSSCGLAAVAAWLALYWHQPVTELDLAQHGLAQTGWTGQKGVSLGDLARLMAQAGFLTRGLRLTWTQLEALLISSAPVLVHYHWPQGHFALALGIRQRWVVVADPARGTQLVDRLVFESRWSGAVLTIVAGSGERNLVALQGLLERQWRRLDALERCR